MKIIAVIKNNSQLQKIKRKTGSRWAISLLLMAFLIQAFSGYAQKNEAETKLQKKDSLNLLTPQHSPRKATLFSMALPGLGQAYNKKYWKIPIVYAGFGVLSYYIIGNNDKYQKYKEAYRYVATGDTTPTTNPYVNKYSEDQLLTAKNYFRQRLELSYILTGVWYILNVVDATVDAHFFDYDISETLSLKIEPTVNYAPFVSSSPQPGVRLTFKF